MSELPEVMRFESLHDDYGNLILKTHVNGSLIHYNDYESLRQQLEAAQQRIAAYEGALKLYMKALNKMAKGGTTDAYCEARDNLEKVYKQAARGE